MRVYKVCFIRRNNLWYLNVSLYMYISFNTPIFCQLIILVRRYLESNMYIRGAGKICLCKIFSSIIINIGPQMFKNKIVLYSRIDPGWRTLRASQVTLHKLTDNLEKCGPQRGERSPVQYWDCVGWGVITPVGRMVKNISQDQDWLHFWLIRDARGPGMWGSLGIN